MIPTTANIAHTGFEAKQQHIATADNAKLQQNSMNRNVSITIKTSAGA